MNYTSKYLKRLTHKSGYMLASLRVEGSGFAGFLMVDPAGPNANIIEQKFASDLQREIKKDSNEEVVVSIKEVIHAGNRVDFTFVILDEDGGVAAAVELPPLGSVLKSANGFTGQVIAYSKERPTLLKIRWHKLGVNGDRVFETLESPGAHEVLSSPLDNMWWPTGTELLPAVPIVNLGGTPVHELTEPDVTAPEDVVFISTLDREAEKMRGHVVSPTGVCACGCGGSCKSYFMPGHDARAKGLLKRKMAGGEVGWNPTPQLVDYVKSHPLWNDQFGAFLNDKG